MTESNVYVFDGLDYRHWDTWNDGTFNHVILTNNQTQEKIDLLKDEPYYSPQMPFGGSEDLFGLQMVKKLSMFLKRKPVQNMHSAPIPICMNTILKPELRRTLPKKIKAMIPNQVFRPTEI